MPSRTPRYEVRLTNDQEDRGYACMTIDECLYLAREHVGRITIYRGKAIVKEMFSMRPMSAYLSCHGGTVMCESCDGDGTMLRGGTEVPCESCEGLGVVDA